MEPMINPYIIYICVCVICTLISSNCLTYSGIYIFSGLSVLVSGYLIYVCISGLFLIHQLNLAHSPPPFGCCCCCCCYSSRSTFFFFQYLFLYSLLFYCFYTKIYNLQFIPNLYESSSCTTEHVLGNKFKKKNKNNKNQFSNR